MQHVTRLRRGISAQDAPLQSIPSRTARRALQERPRPSLRRDNSGITYCPYRNQSAVRTPIDYIRSTLPSRDREPERAVLPGIPSMATPTALRLILAEHCARGNVKIIFSEATGAVRIEVQSR